MAKNIFQQVEMKRPESNTFDLSHNRKMSLKMGELVPILLIDTLPGDVFTMSTSQMLRMSPLIAPIMDMINVYTHFFFVPNRIVWNNFQEWMSPKDGIDYVTHPFVEIDLSTLPKGSIADYLGLPIGGNSVTSIINPIPFACYSKIWNEYYRDQNLIDVAPDSVTDGDQTTEPIMDVVTQTAPPPRAWQHDYFTSALPWTQKGPEVTIPLGTSAQLVYEGDGNPTLVKNTDGTNYQLERELATKYPIVPFTTAGTEAGGDTEVSFDVSSQHYVDLTTATAAGIIDLRRAMQMQVYLEMNARGGTRYSEFLKINFGVISSDSRLQRPEFLGGSTSAMTISEVLQTSNNDTQETPQGNMAGHGISVGVNSPIRYRCEEHGWIVGIMSVMPKASYFQGIPKMWTKFDKFDVFLPAFQHIGEQAILNKEIYLSDDAELNEEVFGYIPRNAEYKYMPNTVHGEFRDTLDFWHMAQKYENMPTLNQEFIECIPTDRIFAVTDSEQIYAQVYHSIKRNAKMAYYGNPKNM